ncbi:hypothetical protein FS837_009247 [Tulasnella sp. UAMH 9824]|nr:hypothetical protein FS837_009247 [Tulasnella sp. UAMH 9824]
MCSETSDLDNFFTGKAKETFQYYWDATRSQVSLDEKLTALEECQVAMMKAFDLEAVELRRMRNTWARLHRLPMEIFITILLQVVEDHDENTDDEPTQLHNLARVCSHWRAVLLNYSEFWKALSPLFEPHFQRWTLERNPNGLLRIYYIPQLSMLRGVRIEFLDLVVRHGGRWQRLVFQDTFDEEICKLLRQEMPRLTDIFINNTMDDSPLPSPELFLSEGVTLRYLSLANATVRWDSVRIQNLRALELGRITQCLPSVHQLHAILSSSPQLWCLMLLDLSMESALDGESPRGEIHLPCLTMLAVRSIPDPITQMILSTVNAPACNFVILSNLQPRYIRNFPSKLEALTRPSLQNRASMGCSVTTSSPNSAAITLSSIPVPEIPSGWLYHITEPTGVEVTFNVPNSDEGGIKDVINWIASLVPISQLPEELVLALDDCDLPGQLVLCSSRLGQIAVTKLRLFTLETITKLLQWLNNCQTRVKDRDRTDDDERPCFPLLDTVYLDCGDFINLAFPALLKFIELRVGPVGESDSPPSQVAKPSSSNNVNPQFTIGAPDLWLREVKECLEGYPVDVVEISDPMQRLFEY